MHLVGDDRAAHARELRELDDARPRHARPGLREHARRALAQHEVERQVAELGGETAPRASRRPGPTSTSVNGSGRPSRSQTRAQVGASARAKNGEAIGAVVNAPRAPSRAPRA